MRGILIAILSLMAASCSVSKALESSLNPSERAVIRGAVDDIARGDSASLNEKVTPELAPRIAGVFQQMHGALPQPPLEISLLGANWSIGRAVRNLHAVYQVHGATGWAIIEATTQTSGNRTVLTGIYVRPTTTDPSQINRFKLSNAGAAQFLMLAAMLAAIGVTIAALVRIWHSGLFSRRWLWTVGALVGLTSLRMNWSTGEWAFQPFMVQLFSAGAVKQPIFAPWILSVGFPLVAVIALVWRRRGLEDGAGVEADAT